MSEQETEKPTTIGASTLKMTLRGLAAFTLNLAAATIGVWFSAGFFRETALVPIIGQQASYEMALKPPYPLLLIFGLLSGYISRIRWRGPYAFWVWIPPAIYLAVGIMLWLQTGFQIRDVFNHFFGLHCFPMCEDQYQRTVPLYTSLAYSFGALARKNHVASRGAL